MSFDCYGTRYCLSLSLPIDRRKEVMQAPILSVEEIRALKIALTLLSVVDGYVLLQQSVAREFYIADFRSFLGSTTLDIEGWTPYHRRWHEWRLKQIVKIIKNHLQS